MRTTLTIDDDVLAVARALAGRRGGRLATFDTGMADLLAEAERDWVETIPV